MELKKRLYHRHGDPQHAAGRPHLGQARPSSCWARWWSSATPSEIFSMPKDKRTEDYITGRLGLEADMRNRFDEQLEQLN